MEKREVQTPVVLFNQYEVVRKLSGRERRKFSTVFLCKDLISSNYVVCKAISKSQLSDSALKKILIEASLQINHTRVVNTIDQVDTDEFLYLIFPYIEGISFAEFVHQNRKRTRRKFAPVFFRQAFDLIKEVHLAGFTHNDIKPENFIIKDDELYLIDFGLCQRKDAIIKGKTVFAMGYSSPELVLNYSTLLCDQSDYYSLGICLWYLFVGDIPLRHEHPAYFINLQITHPIPDHRNIPKKWFEVIEELTSKIQFPKPPNQMNREDVIELLKSSIHKRPNIDRMEQLISSTQQIK